MRWASLLPEATQWIQALGREKRLIARSHLCEGKEHLPVCTRIGTEASGWERYVGPYAPDFGTLADLRPEGVLSVLTPPPDLSEAELIQRFQAAVGYAVQVFSLQAQDWEGYQTLVSRLGMALQAEKAAQAHLLESRKRLDRLRNRLRDLSASLRVAFLQPGPLPVGIDHWAPLLAETAGLTPALPPKPLTWETLLETDPDLIVLSFPGATLAAAGEALAAWSRTPQVQSLTAFRQKRLYALKGTAGLFYPSPATVATAEALYELAYTPSYRHNQHFGRLWAPLL